MEAYCGEGSKIDIIKNDTTNTMKLWGR